VASTITSAGAVSLRAAVDIGSNSNHIEIGGVNDLILNLDDGDFFISGSGGVGGSGGALSSFTLSLEPDEDGDYVVENFADQVFDFAQGGFDDNLVIREIISASLLDLTITTRNDGMVIGGTGGAGIQLAGASDVTLNSDSAIEEADIDDGATVVAEITSDGRLTLVANTDIGSSGVLDLAADATGVSALQATSNAGVLRVNGLDDLRVEGSGIQAAGGGSLASGGALTITANVESGADMTFTAGSRVPWSAWTASHPPRCASAPVTTSFSMVAVSRPAVPPGTEWSCTPISRTAEATASLAGSHKQEPIPALPLTS
jgi:hypothetical protein